MIILMSTVFRSKVLESHSERVYGSKTERFSTSESESDSSTRELSPPTQHNPQPVLSVAADLESAGVFEKDSEGVSIHEQHERFMEKQIRLATSYKEKQECLPRTISSKRSAANEGESCEGFVSRKKEKLSSSGVEEADEQLQASGIQKGPRTVSRAEKNRRRKLKKKKRLARKS